ncbi:hypothetical protein [Acidipropionibacterium virtanenii]|uniref:Uncharacterized protein n=1 Tax=Acidipropionibacterium virtanenii TaxID=2057246 RepID=A0A344UXX2_9ACTN|nr:hypothetical protein [Acidipropionibacterium virtanenii]AXE40120.1 hypothetical protein JS278_02986 [Acidipropionibacterium virtanenii]
MDTDVQAEVQIPVDVRIAVKQTLSYPDWQEWIPWAWAMLARAGDVPMVLDEDAPDYLSHVITFASTSTAPMTHSLVPLTSAEPLNGSGHERHPPPGRSQNWRPPVLPDAPLRFVPSDAWKDRTSRRGWSEPSSAEDAS